MVAPQAVERVHGVHAAARPTEPWIPVDAPQERAAQAKRRRRRAKSAPTDEEKEDEKSEETKCLTSWKRTLEMENEVCPKEGSSSMDSSKASPPPKKRAKVGASSEASPVPKNAGHTHEDVDCLFARAASKQVASPRTASPKES